MSTLVTNASEVCVPSPEGTGVDRLADHAFVIDAGRVAWLGPRDEAPAADEVYDAGGLAVLPALVDCHTHLVHAGDRVEDFALQSAKRFAAVF